MPGFSPTRVWGPEIFSTLASLFIVRAISWRQPTRSNNSPDSSRTRGTRGSTTRIRCSQPSREESLAAVGDRLTEADPLGEHSGLITARAHLEIGDEQTAAEGLDRTESAPVHVEGLQLLQSQTETSLQGSVVGNTAVPGTSVRLRFTFYGSDGALGTEPLTVSAPPAGVSARFEVSFAGQATAYRYELVSTPP